MTQETYITSDGEIVMLSEGLWRVVATGRVMEADEIDTATMRRVVVRYDIAAYWERRDIRVRQYEAEMMAKHHYLTARHPLQQLPAARHWNRVVESKVRIDKYTRETDRRFFNACIDESTNVDERGYIHLKENDEV